MKELFFFNQSLYSKIERYLEEIRLFQSQIRYKGKKKRYKSKRNNLSLYNVQLSLQLLQLKYFLSLSFKNFQTTKDIKKYLQKFPTATIKENTKEKMKDTKARESISSFSQNYSRSILSFSLENFAAKVKRGSVNRKGDRSQKLETWN